MENYFDGAPDLVRSLKAKGKTDLLAAIEPSNMASGAISYIRQQEALGLGHAVWCARRLVSDEPFAVILPDDVIASDRPCLSQMVEAYEADRRQHRRGDERAGKPDFILWRHRPKGS